MLRKIIDSSKLNKEILALFIEKFPDGYDDEDIITFRNAKNEVIEAVEIKTEDTIYLIKVGKRLIKALEEYDNNEDHEEDDGDSNNITDLPNEEME